MCLDDRPFVFGLLWAGRRKKPVKFVEPDRRRGALRRDGSRREHRHLIGRLVDRKKHSASRAGRRRATDQTKCAVRRASVDVECGEGIFTIVLDR